ncbi:AbrB/MazE/SpoVT family DNA-binding domain-containing protein [Phreatobacter sp.]|uniref:AbrB/MazE/SpoVT family DNA-binding domain-containing protein n=1 Tax=Phreatobacter sp. TaxID=1966341 RepID=UPI003F6F5F79
MNMPITKWGNSLALRIPSSFAKEIGVGEGAIADLSVENGTLVVRPVAKPAYDLAMLVSGITEANLHGETDTGYAAGNEIG